jgi:hypothetical protein
VPGVVAKINGYRTTWGGRTTAKKTSKKKAQSQLNLLRGVEHGWKPTGAPARYKRVARPER